MQAKQNVVEKTVLTLTVPSFSTEHEFIIDQIGVKIHTQADIVKQCIHTCSQCICLVSKDAS